MVARFDGDTLTDVEIRQKLQNLPKELRRVAEQRKKAFVEDIAAEHFLVKEAEKRGISSDAEVKALIETARRKIIVAKLIEKEVDEKVKVGPDEAAEYYESHKEEFMTPLLLRASHILVKTAEAAEAVRQDVVAGADFEQTARTRSQDSTAMRGGDLGFFQKGQLVPEFEAAAFAMKKGEIGPVVKTQFGYHVMKLTDRVEPMLRDFRSVKPAVEQRLVKEKRSQAFREFVEKLKKGKPVAIDDKALAAMFDTEKTA